MTEDEFSAEIARIVRDTLRDSPAAHKRRCAIRQGRVEPEPCPEGEHDIDPGMQWCRKCGLTREEYYGMLPPPPPGG